jgi:hypothetical protein
MINNSDYSETRRHTNQKLADMSNPQSRSTCLIISQLALFFSLTALLPVCAAASGEFMDCGLIESDVERLACYDEAYRNSTARAADASTLANEQAGNDEANGASPGATVQPGDQKSGSKAEAEFGLPKTADPDELQVLRSPVERVAKNSLGRNVFYLENGQVWVQTESRTMRLPEDPAIAEITPGRFGGFFLALEGWKQRIKVKRVR